MNKQLFIIIIFLIGIVHNIHADNPNDFLFSPINSIMGLSDNQVRNITQLNDNRMVITTDGNINIYDGESFKYIHSQDDNKIRLSAYTGFYRVYTDGDSLLWIKDMHKLTCIDLGKEIYLHSKEIYNIIGHEDIIDFFIDNSGNRLIVTQNKVISSAGNEITIPQNLNYPLQDIIINNNEIYFLFSCGKMIIKNIINDDIINSVESFSKNESKFYTSTSNIYQTEDGFFQIKNGEKGILIYYDFKTGNIQRIIQTDYWLNTLTFDSNNIYISCRDGLWHLNHLGTKTFISSLKKTDGQRVSGEISSVLLDRDGGIWLGTLNKGILYHHPDRFRLKYYSKHYFGINQDQDIYITGFFNHKDSVIINTSKGLYIFHGNNTLTKTSIEAMMIGCDEKERFHLSENLKKKRYTISETDTNGGIWIGTNDGLILKSASSGKERKFYTEEGLINNYIKSIIKDNDGNILISTSNGISSIKYDETNENITSTNYNFLDGALPEEYLEGSVFKSANGDIFFGGINGFSIVQKNLSKTSSTTPVLRSLDINGERIIMLKEYDKNIILDKSPAFTTDITLNYNQNFISFEFVAPNYKNHAHTSYKYMLEGVDKDWRYSLTGSHNENNSSSFKTIYTSVPPGKYVFRISSSYRNGPWCEKEKILNILIKRPWWKTITAYCIYSLFSIILIITFLYIYTQITKRKLQREHKEEMLLLRIKNLVEECNKYQMISERSNIDTNETENKNNEESLTHEQQQFIRKAIEYVEQNIDNSGYSVEQLSKDLCMDRTGLYKKLTAALDQSPSLFIRSIRLRKASSLIKENKMNLSEIAYAVGFNSLSYMSKCFHEEYGCKPSEYLSKIKTEKCRHIG